MTKPSISASEIYARRKVAAQTELGAQPQHHAVAAQPRATAGQGINYTEVYARRREEAQARGRAAGYVR